MVVSRESCSRRLLPWSPVLDVMHLHFPRWDTREGTFAELQSLKHISERSLEGGEDIVSVVFDIF